MKFFSALLVVAALIITPSLVKCSPNKCDDSCCDVKCCTSDFTVLKRSSLNVPTFVSCIDRFPKVGVDRGCRKPDFTQGRASCPFGFKECLCVSHCFATKNFQIISSPGCGGQNPGQEVFSQGRRLDGVLMELDNYGWDDYKRKCNSFSYELRLYVDSHLMLLVVPNDDEAVAVGCAPLALHSTINHRNGTWEKQAWVYDKSKLEEFNAMKKDSMELHSHPFLDIAVAYELAEAGGTSTDVVLYNCGDFAKSFCAIVGEKFTPAMTMNIAQRLIEKSDGAIIRNIHSSDHVSTLVVEGDDDSSTSDEELVYRLVESRTRELYNL